MQECKNCSHVYVYVPIIVYNWCHWRGGEGGYYLLQHPVQRSSLLSSRQAPQLRCCHWRGGGVRWWMHKNRTGLQNPNFLWPSPKYDGSLRQRTYSKNLVKINIQLFEKSSWQSDSYGMTKSTWQHPCCAEVTITNVRIIICQFFPVAKNSTQNICKLKAIFEHITPAPWHTLRFIDTWSWIGTTHYY